MLRTGPAIIGAMTDTPISPAPSRQQIRRWRRYLADEHAEAAVYRDLATRRDGAERDILLALADAEGRHAAHWRALLGPHADKVATSGSGSVLGWFAKRFGSVFVLALVQRAEGRSAYGVDADATAAMAADERIHEEVVRSLATQGRAQMSGNFRAAVFGANDGLVSNLALILGIGASGVSNSVVLITGLAGLLAGALSMGAGEFVSVSSQRELADASNPDPTAHSILGDLDVNANELALVYRARGMSEDDAAAQAAHVLTNLQGDGSDGERAGFNSIRTVETDDLLGSPWGAAISSFLFFASGAIIPVLPYLFGAQGLTAVLIAAGLVAIALCLTGAAVGVLSGTSPLKRALRQIAIGLGAAGATYLLGLLFGGLAG